MNWTLSRSTPECSDLVDQYLLASGKALCLAANFEATCKHILRVFRITDAIRSGSSNDEVREVALRNNSQRWQSLKLARAIEEIGNADDVDDEDAKTLGVARLSRNYVAHDSAGMGPIALVTPAMITQMASDLMPQVIQLARGEWLVSAWSFEIGEREPASVDRDKYVAAVVAWVFGELAYQIALPSVDCGCD